MRNLLIAAVAVAGAAAASPASAALTVLDFNGDACEIGPGCPNGGTIAQSYGDGVGVDVSYATFIFNGNPSDEPLRYWGTGYGDLSGVVFGGLNQTDYFSRIVLSALAGYEISLRSFDIASFNGLSVDAPVLIESVGGTGILAGQITTLYPGHNHVTVNSAWFTDGIALNWGPDGFNVGLDNITFDVRALGGGAVPEPGTWATMIMGFAAIGGLVRKDARQRRAAA